MRGQEKISQNVHLNPRMMKELHWVTHSYQPTVHIFVSYYESISHSGEIKSVSCNHTTTILKACHQV